MTNSLAQKLGSALFGVQPITTMQQNEQYPSGIQNFLDSLDKQPYMQGLLNQPKQTGLSLNQIKEGVAQGLNFGVPELADAQKELKINIPQTEEEKELAKTGLFNQYPLQAGLTAQPNQGGFFNDFMSGYRDNYDNAFNPDNLMPQNKGLATKTGELFGSIGRFIDSPLGRGLIAGGLTSALGYKNGLQEGLTAMVGRQNAQTQDKLYRQDLQNQGVDTSNIRGNITGNIYKNLSNNIYRQNNLALRQQATESMNKLRELQIEKQKILNSTLPEEQKAKLIKLNAEAAHAEEMQIARINYYNNAVANPLGWANYGLKADEVQKKAQQERERTNLIKEIVGGGGENKGQKQTQTSTKPRSTTSGHKTNAF